MTNARKPLPYRAKGFVFFQIIHRITQELFSARRLKKTVRRWRAGNRPYVPQDEPPVLPVPQAPEEQDPAAQVGMPLPMGRTGPGL